MEECKSEAVARLRDRASHSLSAHGGVNADHAIRALIARAPLKSKHKIHAPLHTWLRFEAADARDWKTFRPGEETLPCTFSASVRENPAKKMDSAKI